IPRLRDYLPATLQVEYGFPLMAAAHQPSEMRLAREMPRRSAASARAWRSVSCTLGSSTMFDQARSLPLRREAPALSCTLYLTMRRSRISEERRVLVRTERNWLR